MAARGTVGVYGTPSIDRASTSNALYEKTSDYPAAGTTLDLDWEGQYAIVVNPGIGGVVSVSQA
jgi:hypothetical protein